MAYQTKQGRALVEYLRSQGSRHVSVQQIAAGLPEPIGIATIYRQLEKLAARGLVQKYVNDGGPACYQYVGEDRSGSKDTKSAERQCSRQRWAIQSKKSRRQ